MRCPNRFCRNDPPCLCECHACDPEQTRKKEAAAAAITADDVRLSRLDTDAQGHVFPEVKLAAALQVLRSIRDEQPTASAVLRGLCAATIERIEK